MIWHPLLVAFLLAASNVAIHTLGSYIVFHWLLQALRKHPVPSIARAWSTLMRLVLVLLLTHAIEVAVWAGFYISQHCFADRETAYYFSITSYTTLGYGDIVLPRPWRIMGGFEAMVGVLMFGWSTATIVAFMHYILEVRIKKHTSVMSA